MKIRLVFALVAVVWVALAVWLALTLTRGLSLATPPQDTPTVLAIAPTSAHTVTWTPNASSGSSQAVRSTTFPPTPLPEPSQTSEGPEGPPSPSPTASPSSQPPDPFALVSQESLFAYLEDLTAIQPYSGWRNSASEGEAEALDYVQNRLRELEYLNLLGMELEREEFRVFLGTELWDTRLHLSIDGSEVEVPADGLRGPRDDIAQALRFDSDGSLNDSVRNPQIVQGAVTLVGTPAEVSALQRQDLEDKIVFLDYSAVDRIVQGSVNNAVDIAWELLDKQPSGVVLVTSFSNKPGESHGTFVGDVSALNWVSTATTPPILYARLEDFSPAGIDDWDDLKEVESARVTWDADVLSPAVSGNLVAGIPGIDGSRAMILGAHIDSPNSPGAMDDGSGSAILLEIARILNASKTQPPTNLYLVWFGSEELGLYGSSHFAATHQELLDQTQAMLQTDMLSHPLDGIEADLTFVTWSYGRLGDERLLWPEHLIEVAGSHGIETRSENVYHVYSDNSSFGGYGVPHADLIYQDLQAMEATGSLHYAAHIHDPYDTVELAQQEGATLEKMARVVLAAALDAPLEFAALRVPPAPKHRAVFVGSHTESAHMTPAAFTDLGMALSMEGYDVDLIPYGEAVTAEALANADLVIVLPVVDYPSPDGDTDLYDEAWSAEEVAALEAYVTNAGLLVITNSANRLKYSNRVLDANEDWADMNAIGSRFGFTFGEGILAGGQADIEANHPVVEGIAALSLAPGNGVPIRIEEAHEAQILAQAGGDPVVALLSHGEAGGEVLILADVGLLGSDGGPPDNLRLWLNLAQYARE